MKPKAPVRPVLAKLRLRAQARALGGALDPVSQPRPFLVHTLRLRSRKPLR